MNTTGTSVQRSRSGLLSYLSLFTSFSTLFCCAVPSRLVLAGLGATVASVVSEVPGLVTLSHHKNWVFAIAGVLISISGDPCADASWAQAKTASSAGNSMARKNICFAFMVSSCPRLPSLVWPHRAKCHRSLCRRRFQPAWPERTASRRSPPSPACRREQPSQGVSCPISFRVIRSIDT